MDEARAKQIHKDTLAQANRVAMSAMPMNLSQSQAHAFQVYAEDYDQARNQLVAYRAVDNGRRDADLSSSSSSSSSSSASTARGLAGGKVEFNTAMPGWLDTDPVSAAASPPPGFDEAKAPNVKLRRR